MFNDFENYISIHASEELVEKIAEFIRSENSAFDFEKIIPIPENVCPYDWCTENWGTGANAHVEVDDPGDYWLKTAGTPCEPVIAELARLFPEAEFTHTYEDLELETFCGQNIYQNGKLVYKMDGDIHYDWSAEDPGAWSEEERMELKMEDELFPAPETDNAYICEATEDGKFYHRDYRDGRLFRKIDGVYEDWRPEGKRTYYW